MRDILFLAHRIPYPPDRGDKIRSWNMLKHLAGLSRVHLACFADDEADAAHLPALRQALGGRLGEAHVEIRRRSTLGAAVKALRTGKPVSLTAFESPAIGRFVEGLLGAGEIGTVFAFSGQMAQFVPEGLQQPFLMDFVDMDSAKFNEYAKGRLAWAYRREAAKLFAFERATAARADASIFVSEAEAALFRSKTALPSANILAISNGIDLDFYDPEAAFPRLESSPGKLIVFTGQMDYRPNVDAVTSFAAEVLPQLGGAHFAIVGRSPTAEVQRLAAANVTVTGAVEDVRSWLAAADIVVAPLRIARGIQNKVLEAMAMARPVVASAAAFEGIEAEPGLDLIVADTAKDQVRAIKRLLADPDERNKVAQAARRRMEEAYRWEERLKPLTNLVDVQRRQAAA